MDKNDHTTMIEALRLHYNMDDCINWILGLGSMETTHDEEWTSLVADTSPYCASQLAAECKGEMSPDYVVLIILPKGCDLNFAHGSDYLRSSGGGSQLLWS